MSISNLNIQFIIQLDIPRFLNLMIQRIEQVGKKGSQLTFILFTLNWLAIKDLKTIKNQKAKKVVP